MEITLYGASPAPQWPWPQPQPGITPVVPPQEPAPAQRDGAALLAALDKKRVRVAVRVDENGIVHVRLEGPLGLAAEVSGRESITIETEI